MKNDVRKLTDGAMMAAIIGAVLLINRQTAGLLEATVLFLYPLPMVFYGAKYGWKDSWMVFGAIAILGFILGTPATGILVMCEALIGMVYGCEIYQKVPTNKIVVRTIVVSVLVCVFTTLVFAQFFGYDLQTEMSEIASLFTTMSETAGVSFPSQVDIAGMIRSVMIVTVILTGVLDALVLHAVSTLLLKRFRISYAKGVPFMQYYPKMWSGYLAIAGLVAFYYVTFHPFENDVLNLAVQGIGMCGSFYLLFYGMIATMLLLSRFLPHSKFLATFIAIGLMFLAGLALEIIGFLYITTSMHQRLLEGGIPNESKNS